MKNILYKAILKSVSGRFSAYLFQFFAIAIYARLFTPKEFGIIASIHVFVVFFQMLADIGIGPAIINEDEFGSNKRNGIFTVTAIIGCILAVLFFLFSYLLNSFYGAYEYQEIAVFVCVAIFFSSMNIVPTTAMNKDAKFIHLAGVDIFSECLALFVVYSLYMQEFGLLALAARPAVQAITKFFIIWLMSNRTQLGRPYFGVELYHIKSILRFSSYQFGFNFVNYFSRNLDNLLIAKYFGMVAVGIYDKSYQLMRYPLMVTTFAMTPAIQPVLTKFRNDVYKVIIEHNRLTARLFALSLPISFFIWTNSNSIILFLFGEQWLEVNPLIKIFSLTIPIQTVLSTSGSFFQVMNKPRLLFISGFIAAGVSVTAIITGIILGELKYVAIALVAAFSINFLQIYFVLFRYCFNSSSSSFYLGLIRTAGVMLLPLISYYSIHSLFLANSSFSAATDLLVNVIFGLLSIIIFFFPIRKVLS